MAYDDSTWSQILPFTLLSIAARKEFGANIAYLEYGVNLPLPDDLVSDRETLLETG